MKAISVFVWLGVCLAFCAQAGIVVYPTRVVVTMDNKQGSLVTLSNTTQNSVYLVQAYISDVASSGSNPLGLKPSSLFQIEPPLVRIEGQGKAMLRVMPLAGTVNLPKDRESLFYFNARTIPTLSPLARNPAERNTGGAVSMLITMREKLIYRPARLPMTQKAAFAGLQFVRQPGVIVVKNPSAYYLSLKRLTFGGKAVSLALDKNSLIAPYSEQRYPVNATATTASWAVVSDEGTTLSFSGLIH